MNEAEKSAFEVVLSADPYDQVTRLVFADWLMENGLDDEAVLQRAWTKEWQEAADYLTEFGGRVRDTIWSDDGGTSITDPDSPGFSLSELVDVMDKYREDGEMHCLPFDTPDFIYGELEKLWMAYRVYRGMPESGEGEEDVPFEDSTLFRCAC